MTDRLVWIDCEMTGLDLAKDALIEIAALVTDADLNVLGDGLDLVIHADEEALANMPDVVREMHARSGLTEEVRRSTVTIEEAEQRVLDYVRQHVPEAGGAPLAGNSIATDRGFITREMPALEGLQTRLSGPSFEVVAINIDTRDPDKPKNFLKEANLTRLGYFSDRNAKVFQDLKAIGRALGMPTSVLVDGQGCEIATIAGPAEWNSDDAVKLIQAAMKPAAAGF